MLALLFSMSFVNVSHTAQPVSASGRAVEADAPVFKDDTDLKEKVETKLLEDKRLDTSSIRIAVKHGIIIVMGRVDTLEQLDRAITLISKVEGVKQVVPRLKVALY